MTTPSDEQRVKWLVLLEAERDRRAAKVRLEAAAGEREREKLVETIIEMGPRLLAGGEPVVAILDELVEAEGDRECIDAIRNRADMSMAEACALILMKDPETAVGLLEKCGREAMHSAQA